VISKISGILGQKGISIASVIQKARKEGDMVPIVIMTYEAKEKDVQEALRSIDQLPVVMQPTVMIRVENLDA
jgi:homoserine dehydrogenase